MRRRFASFVAYACAALGCGDNRTPIGPPLAHSDSVFFAAHPDDDMIFMQPDLLRQLGSGSLTTIYATTAGPEGIDHALFEAAKVAYAASFASADWECGEIEVGTISAHHCRLREHSISLVDFGLPDGGVPGDRRDSLLHLVDGTVAELRGFYGGQVTGDSAVALFASVFDATRPTALQTLDLGANHGRDHSSHLFVASYALWAAARVAFTGSVTWNRGYNVDVEEPTLDGDELSAAHEMLGHFEACAGYCGPCGAPCKALLPAHQTWLERQYTTERVTRATGKLALGETCLGTSLVAGDCADAPSFELDASGALRLGDRCVTTAATGDVALEPCVGAPEQYWVLDTEGSLWNGRVPAPAADMHYDHVRCLASAGAPTCGAGLRVQWTFLP